MTDLSKLSDEELEKLAAQGSGHDLSQLSDQELERMASGAEPGPEKSPVTSATTGLMNLHGWGPRIGALGDTVMKGVTGVAGPLAGGSLGDLGRNYNNTRDKLQSEFKTAHDANPKIATAANVAADVAALSALGPAAASTEGLLGAGAIEGAGGVNVDKPEDLVALGKATAGGALSNLVAGKVMNALARGRLSPTEGLDPNLNIGHAALAAKRAANPGAETVGNGLVGRAVRPVTDRLSSGAEVLGDAITSHGPEVLGSVAGAYQGYKHGGMLGGLGGLAAGAALGHKTGPIMSFASNALGEAVKSAPEMFGKFASILSSAAARGAASLAITDKVLQETDAEYRKLREQVAPSGPGAQ